MTMAAMKTTKMPFESLVFVRTSTQAACEARRLTRTRETAVTTMELAKEVEYWMFGLVQINAMF